MTSRRCGAAAPGGHRRRKRAGLLLEEIKELLDHGNDPMSDHLRELAARRLPDIDALIQRAQRARSWRQTAQSCGCPAIDECRLFDDAAAPPAGPVRLSVRRDGGVPA